MQREKGVGFFDKYDLNNYNLDGFYLLSLLYMGINRKDEDTINKQKKGFIDELIRSRKISKKTGNSILKLLEEDSGFWVWIKEKLSLKNDLYKKQDINKMLTKIIKNKIVFDDLWKEYIYYIKKNKQDELKEKKAKNFFKPYITNDLQLNDKIIGVIKDFLSSKDDMEKIDIILKSDIYQNMKWHHGLHIQYIDTIIFAIKNIIKNLDKEQIRLILNLKDTNRELIETKIEKIKENIEILKESGYNIKYTNINILISDNLEDYIDVLEGFEINNSEKMTFLKKCINYDLDGITNLLNRVPTIHYEGNGGYTSDIVQMEGGDWNNEKITKNTIKELIYNCRNDEDLEILEKLRTLYWTNNRKKNINFAKEKGIISSTEILPYQSNEDTYRNWKIAEMKTVHNQDRIKIIKKMEELGANRNYIEKLSVIILGRGNVVKRIKILNILIDDIGIKDYKRILEADDYNSEDPIKIMLDCDENTPEQIKENIKIIKSKGIRSTADLVSIMNILCNVKIENIKNRINLITKSNKNTPDIILVINDLYMCGLLTEIDIPKESKKKLELYNSEEIKQYINNIIKVAKTSYENNKKIDIINRMISLDIVKADEYLEVFKIFDESISQDVQHIKNELIDEVLLSDNPKEVAKKINDIFIKNNLPFVGKIFKVFVELYKEERFNKELSKGKTSPVLNSIQGFKKKQSLIYKDLMNITIKSSNISLREYIDIFLGIENIIRKFESVLNNLDYSKESPLEGVLTEKEQEKLLYFLRKLDTLHETSSGNIVMEPEKIEKLQSGKSDISDKKLIEYYKNLKKIFLTKEDESLYDNLIKFLRPLGYNSFEEVKKEMELSKKTAHKRGIDIYNEAINNGGKVYLGKGDFIKGIQNIKIMENILERGCTSREYLGGGDESGSAKAGSDFTPFDIDGGLVTEDLSEYNFNDIVSKSISSGYGGISLVVKNKRGTLYDTREKDIKLYNKNKYEIFQTGTNDHYGIRTGIPSTEIDFLIVKEDFLNQSKEFEKLCYEIAKNGFYIPIVNIEGEIIFTPEMYSTIKKTFMYCEKYEGYDVVQELGISKEVGQDNTFSIVPSESELGTLLEANSPNNIKYKEFSQQNKELAISTMEKIKNILEEKCGIKFSSEFDNAIVGAEIHDSGSTGRGTDIPTKDVDLDFTLLLDARNYERLEEIKNIIHKEIGTKEGENLDGPRENGLGWQIKSKKNTLGNRDDGIALDLLIMKKTQVIEYSSSDAASDRLKYIIKKYGERALEQVRTNIIIMKKLLKAKNCYKKPEGGFGGIGVENRILQNHGSFLEALESFEKKAYGGIYTEGKKPISLEEFKQRYPIYDIGENYKDGGKDNFVHKMGKQGYIGILEIIKEYRKSGLQGLKKILNQYIQNKSEFGAI